ncbi:hypothetical protein Pmani_001974 [Petrolisthes manimaculis]|uniref:Uncharacterized protein n=1 Tax=Petrolisthes manimaculis TaxID=1843537 RepID=A0AAE1QLX2_9EUCA|nr:hypothetical protein Pmani_001974 [Petrolisthes manimaculis]
MAGTKILETNDNENQESKDENEEIRGKDIEKIVIFPPKDGAETDDDSDDDDTRNLNHLTAPQLVSECEIEGYLGTYQSPAIKSPNCGSRGEKRVHQSVRTDDDMYKRHATKLVVRSVINELE